MKRCISLLINLYVIVLCTFAGQSDLILVKIGDMEISRSAFEYMYRRHCLNGGDNKKTLNEYLDLFVNQKLKAIEAEACGYDTFPSFQDELLNFCDELKAGDDLHNDITAGVYEPLGDEVLVAHIFKYLPQDASAEQLSRTTALMDSIYASLQNGAEFTELAKKYSDDRKTADRGGVLPWFSVNRKTKEFETNAFADLSVGSYTMPFFTPEGCHILKLLGRRRIPRGRYSDISGSSLHVQEFRDAMLSAMIENKVLSEKSAEFSVEAFFRKNKSDYKWANPRFNGVVFYAKDKKQIKVIKKLLKKTPKEKWLAQLEEMKNIGFDILFSGTMFSEGDDANVDKVIFKKGELMPKVGYPYMGTFGKKVKVPDTYMDVAEQVIPDYKKYLEKSWINNLRDKYKVEINQEVLKTVNNH